MPSGTARARITSRTCGKIAPAMTNVVAFGRFCTRCSSVIASAAAVASSSSDAVATSIPVEIADHRLKIQERLETALSDLGLVRRVRRIPARVLEHVSHDDRRRDRVVIAQPKVGAPDLVAGRQAAQALMIRVLGVRRRQVGQRRRADVRGNDLVDERVERRRADGLQHALEVSPRGPRCRD